jgi:hypothetical protein
MTLSKMAPVFVKGVKTEFPPPATASTLLLFGLFQQQLQQQQPFNLKVLGVK